MSADEPATRSGGGALQSGDIWVDTNSDLFEIYSYSGAAWVKRDTADQTTPTLYNPVYNPRTGGGRYMCE